MSLNCLSTTLCLLIMKVLINDAIIAMGEIMHQEFVLYVKCDIRLLFNIV
jgi:hypothetical protein